MSIPDTSEVLAVAKEIEDLKTSINEAEAKLAQLRLRWGGFFSNATIQQEVPQAASKGGRKPDPNSLPSKVVAHIEANREGYDYFTAEELEGAGLGTKQAVERALFKLYSTGKIAKHGRGQYKALEKEVRIAA